MYTRYISTVSRHKVVHYILQILQESKKNHAFLDIDLINSSKIERAVFNRPVDKLDLLNIANWVGLAYIYSLKRKFPHLAILMKRPVV